MDKNAVAWPRATRWLALYYGFLGVVTIVFWVLWFSTDWLHISDWECYFVFERSFPLADAWFTFCALLAATGLWRRRARGWLFALLASSAGIFLALMDLLYSLENGVFWPFTSDSVTELLIVGLLLLPAIWIIPWLWRQRQVMALTTTHEE